MLFRIAVQLRPLACQAWPGSASETKDRRRIVFEAKRLIPSIPSPQQAALYSDFRRVALFKKLADPGRQIPESWSGKRAWESMQSHRCFAGTLTEIARTGGENTRPRRAICSLVIVSCGRHPIAASIGTPCSNHTHTRTPNLPAKIIPTKIRWLNKSGKFPMDTRIPPLKLQILL